MEVKSDQPVAHGRLISSSLSGVDPEYLEYLKMKKQKALEAEKAMTEEQRQMHHALEEMKKSLSYISSKLVTKESRGNLGE